MVDRATERSEAGRKSPESGTLGGAQSFGVTESATVSPKVCAPGDESTNQNTPKKSPLNEPDRVAAMMNKKPVMPVRARCVLVVSGLKPDPRAGDGARCWLQIRHEQACMCLLDGRGMAKGG